MTDLIRSRLLSLPKDLFIDLEDRLRAEAVKAHEMIRDHAGLDPKRMRELVGQARFRMMEKGFEEVCSLYDGKLLDGGLIPKTELKVFQPFMRFEPLEQGVILGLAAMPEPRAVPNKNKSRLAGVSLNYYLSPRLKLDDAGPKVDDVFALFLCSRDREKAGQMEEIAIGIIDSKYEAFLFYERLDGFLSGYAETQPKAPTPPAAPEKSSVVFLKKKITPFVPPETPKPEGEQEESG